MGVPGSANMSVPSCTPICSHWPSMKRMRGSCQSFAKLMTEYQSERATGKASPSLMTGLSYEAPTGIADSVTRTTASARAAARKDDRTEAIQRDYGAEGGTGFRNGSDRRA